LHGELMVVGGLMFGFVGAARLVALMLFLVGIAINLVLGCLAAPDILQMISSAVRNLGLMVMGHPILLKPDPGRLRH
jgi:hypothetical protein